MPDILRVPEAAYREKSLFITASTRFSNATGHIPPIVRKKQTSALKAPRQRTILQQN